MDTRTRAAVVAIAVIAIAVLAIPLPAVAHAHLVDAQPSVGATIATPPKQVAINFSEGVEPRFSTIAVTDASGARVDDGAPHTAPGDAKNLAVPLKPLTPGIYRVTWHATSIDTHKTQGSFTFTVIP